MDIVTYALLKKQISGITPGFSYKGSVADEEDLPANPEKGDLYTVTGEDNAQYVWDGEDWIRLGSQSDAENVSYNNTATYGNGTIGKAVSDLESAVEVLEPTATAADVGKALIAKTVSGGKVTEYEFGEAGDGGSGDGDLIVVTVSGTTPTITASASHRYKCGEVTELSFTPSATGICDVVFTSGTTATILTVPNTVKWPDGFDPTSLEASTTYELNIVDGTLGGVIKWQ